MATLFTGNLGNDEEEEGGEHGQDRESDHGKYGRFFVDVLSNHVAALVAGTVQDTSRVTAGASSPNGMEGFCGT